MSSPFAFAGSLQLPGDQGLPPAPIAINLSSTFSSLNEQVLNLSGTGTKSIPFGTVGSPGLLGLLIKVDANLANQPVLVTVNAGSQPVEISPGGFLAVGSPAPVAGILSLTVAWTSNNVVRIWALG